jgi:hypothetical protein
LAVYGRQAMGKMSRTKVLVSFDVTLLFSRRDSQTRECCVYLHVLLSRLIGRFRVDFCKPRQISGMNGLGAEIAKNVILAQVQVCV